MKNIEIDEELYQYIVSNTQFIGESASSILRRLLSLTLAENTVDDIEVPTSDNEELVAEILPLQIEESIENEVTDITASEIIEPHIGPVLLISEKLVNCCSVSLH